MRMQIVTKGKIKNPDGNNMCEAKKESSSQSSYRKKRPQTLGYIMPASQFSSLYKDSTVVIGERRTYAGKAFK